MCCGNKNQVQSKLILNAKYKLSFPNWIETNFQPISPHGDHNMWKMIKLYICAIKIYVNLLEFLAPIVFFISLILSMLVDEIMSHDCKTS
jgi:hypothetical protein